MEFIPTGFEGLFLIRHDLKLDMRGFFTRTYCKKDFSQINFQKEFVQFNHSFNKHQGTLRGMHYQAIPHTETKLIRCVQGRIHDVVVDVRSDSATFLQSYAVELSEENILSLFIPDGFAHGFQTLADNSALIYHHTEYYTPSADRGLRYDDPALNIQWPLPPASVSEKDTSYPFITEKFKGITI
jgi:dTDP-4-dehydrorhamnose 3,5-epimerase